MQWSLEIKGSRDPRITWSCSDHGGIIDRRHWWQREHHGWHSNWDRRWNLRETQVRVRAGRGWRFRQWALWALGLVKQNMAWDINTVGVWIKTPVSILSEWIAPKNAGCGFWLHFVFVVWFGERITQISKFSQFKIIWLLTKESLVRRYILEYWCGLTIYKVCGHLKSMWPIGER